MGERERVKKSPNVVFHYFFIKTINFLGPAPGQWDYGAGTNQQPGWSIWGGGKWKIPDGDGDNIPGNGGQHYPKYGQKKLCALNPSNPGCDYGDYGAGSCDQTCMDSCLSEYDYEMCLGICC